MYRKFYLIIVLIYSYFGGATQTLKGKITDNENNPIPYATVYVKEIRFGTTSNEQGNYEVKLKKGDYTILYQSLGFETTEKRISIEKGTLILDIRLNLKSYQLQGVKVSPGKEDPAYAIMRKAIGFAPYYLNQISKYNAEVYLKGSFKFKKIAWFVKKMAKNADEGSELPKEGVVYLSESINEINFTAPDKYDQTVKKIRSNFPNGDGDDPMGFINASLYQPKTGDIILPLAPYAFSHYKFRYEGFNMENGRVVNKIKVIPRRKSMQLLEGFIYIADDYWNLHAAELSVETIVGKINIHQNFSEVEKNVWLPVSHYYEILGKIMGNEFDIKYTASIKYKEVSVNTALKPPSKFPETQLAREEPAKANQPSPQKKKTKEEKRAEQIEKLMQKDELNNRDMYQLSKLMSEDARAKDTSKITSLELKDWGPKIKIDSLAKKGDSTLWQTIRPVSLTPEEIDGMKQLAAETTKKDSLKNSTHSTKKRPGNVNGILLGKSWEIDSVTRISFTGFLSPDRARFNTVDGFVYGLGLRFRKRSFFIRPTVDYAFNRKTLMGNIETGFEYSPLKRGIFNVKIGSSSTDFNQSTGVSELGNTIASLYFKTNYMKLYEHQFIEMDNRIDIANGLELSTGLAYYNRTMLENSTSFSFNSKQNRQYSPNIPEKDTAFGSFLPNHSATEVKIGVSFTPRYYYRIHNNRKLMANSKFPTFFLNTTLAVPNVFNSDADFIKGVIGIRQKIRIEPSNELSYRFEVGSFIRRKTLYLPDFKHFNTQLIPVVLSDFTNSFQLLPYYEFSTGTNWASGNVYYQSPYLALKYLPFLSKRFWKENLYASWLFSSEKKPYFEVGYAMDQIGLFGGIGVFAGFQGKEFYGFGIKVSFKLGNEISL